MALDKLVDSSQLDSDLGDIADAIRAKGGTSGQLAFPQGFVDAVEAIETGGGYSISAVFTQGDDKFFTTDALDDLRTNLVVTAHYSDGTSEVINEYLLSGTLVAGNSTITVSALDLTTTFTVLVIAATDVTPNLRNPGAVSGGVSYAVSDDGKTLTLISTANTYRACQYAITLESGMRYRITCDLDYQTGAAAVGFRTATNGTLYVMSSVRRRSGKIIVDSLPSNLEFYTPNSWISFFSSWSTSEVGKLSYKNIKVIAYDDTDPNQVLNVLMGVSE